MGKISGYTAIVAADVAAADVLPIVDVSATSTKKIRADLLLSALLFNSAADITYSGGVVSITGDLTVAGGDIDCGASAAAGSLDVFPATASKGKLRFVAADSAGNTTTTITNASQAGAVTYTIPDAGASASFVMTEGAQTLNGVKTIPAIVTTDIDAGASGTAGSVDIFPTTASKGKISLLAVANTGNTTLTITNAAQAGAVTYTIPDAGASTSFVLGAGAATISGNKTFTGTTEADTLKVGASGTAGVFNVFPTTAAKGSLALAAVDNTGNTTTTISNAAMGQASVITIPDPGASTDTFGLLALAQTYTGAKTFTGGLVHPVVARTATSDGLTTGTIAALGAFQHITVSSASANNIITLPTPTPGVLLVLGVAGNGYKVQSSAPTTVAINGGTGASAKSAIAANSVTVFVCITATAWLGLTLSGTTLASVAAAA